MPNSIIDLTTYQSLLTNLKGLMAVGQAKAMSELNKIRLETYWQMGKQMNETYAQIPKPESELFVGQLAGDLKLDKSLLYRMMQFQELWPSGAPSADDTFLSWTHMVELITVKDEEKRNYAGRAAGLAGELNRDYPNSPWQKSVDEAIKGIR
jgi:hypothetical protein